MPETSKAKYRATSSEHSGTPPTLVLPLDQAEGIVCTGLFDDQTETPDDYRATLLLAKTKGLKMLCANPDIVVDMGDKRVFCAGALAHHVCTTGWAAPSRPCRCQRR